MLVGLPAPAFAAGPLRMQMPVAKASACSSSARQPRRVVERVTVQASRRAEVSVPEPGLYVLPAEALGRRVGGHEDLMRSIQGLPGVSRASDFHGEFFVRGSGSRSNAIYLDGIPIFFPYHILGFNSIFSEGVIDEASFYLGNAPAQFGDATGGVLDVKTKAFAKITPEAGAGVSYLSGYARATGGKEEKGWAVSLRRSYHDKLAHLIDADGSRRIPSFFETMLRSRWRPDPNHVLVAGIIVAGDGLSLPSPESEAADYHFIRPATGAGGRTTSGFGTDGDLLEIDNRLIIGSLHWQARVGSRSLLETTLGYTPQRFGFALTGRNNEFAHVDSRILTLRQDMLVDRGAHQLRLGYQLYRDHTRQHVSSYASFLNLRESNSEVNLVDLPERYDLDRRRVRHYAALHMQDTWRLGGGHLELTPGLRFERDQLARQSLWSPRLSLALRPDESWKLRTSWGVSHGLREKPMEVLPARSGRPLRAERSRQWTLGLVHTKPGALDLGLTYFDKKSDNLVYESEPAYFSNGAESIARGVESYLQFQSKRWPLQTRLQYVYATIKQRNPVNWRKRPDLSPATAKDYWELDYESPYWFRPFQDQRHTIDIESHWQQNRWRFSGRLHWASGRPFTPVDFVYTDIDGQRHGILGQQGGGLLPGYSRLDVRVQRYFGGGRLQWSVYGEILNVLSQDNIYQYRYDPSYTYRTSVSMLPVLPTLGIRADY